MAEDQNNQAEGESLEQQANSLEGSDQAAKAASTETVAYKKSFKDSLVGKLSIFNIYLVVFLVLLLVVILVTVVSLNNAKKSDTSTNLIGQNLTAEDLAKLKETDTKVGDPKQTLTIESNTVINGKVLVRDGLDIAGALTVGSSLSITGLSVSGLSSFQTIRASENLEVAGTGSFQGGLTVSGNLQSSSGATFGGSLNAPTLNVDNINLTGTLVLNRHIDINGSIPSISAGGAVGGGGTVSISGTDTAGTININTGSGTGAGTLANVTFTSAFGGTPHVVLSPVGSAASGVNYYVTRTSTGFTLSTSNAAPASSSFSFDFIVLD